MSITSPRGRSAAYRIPGVCALALLGGAGIWSANRAEHEYTSTSVVTKAPRALLSIQTGGADITVSRGTGQAIRIERRARWVGDPPTRSVTERPDGWIQLEDDCPGGVSLPVTLFAFHDDCSISYEVRVPAGQAVRLDGGSGDIRLVNLDGRVTAVAGSGDLSASGLRSRRTSLATGSGDLSAYFDEQPRSLTASSGSGDVSVRVPNGSYRITASTGSGDRSIDGLTSRSASPRTIVARTGSGDLMVGRSS